MRGCRDVAYLIASDGLAGAGWARRLLVRLHLLYCRHCRRHMAELRTIGSVSRDTWDIASVDSATVRRLEKEVLDQALGKSDRPPPE